MATITSAASGNFSAGATWTGGVVPGAGDVAIVASGHTVTIDGNVTCDELRKEGANHAGKFVLGGEHTVTANVTNACTSDAAVSTGGLLEFTLASGTAAIVGNLTAGTERYQYAVMGSGGGTLEITGTVTAGGDTGSSAVYLTGGSVAVTVTGDVIGGTGVSTSGIDMTGTSAQLTVAGNVTGGSSPSARGVNMTGSAAQLTATGNVTGGSGSSANGIYLGGNTAQATVVGNLTAGDGSNAHAALMDGTSSVIDVTGNVTASSANTALRADGLAIFDGDLVDHPNGTVSHTCAARRVRNGTGNRTIYSTPEVANADGDPVVHASLDYITASVPLPADVRSGVVYSDSGFTGTLAVPPANAVASGVPVDAGTGTAALSPADVAALIGAQIAAALDATP